MFVFLDEVLKDVVDRLEKGLVGFQGLRQDHGKEKKCDIEWRRNEKVGAFADVAIADGSAFITTCCALMSFNRGILLGLRKEQAAWIV